MLKARVLPNGRYGSPRSRRRWVVTPVAVTLLLGLSVLPAGARATPGTPGVPQSPRTVYSEDFEHETGTTPVLLTHYTGAPPLSPKYTAAQHYLEHCNGYIVQFKSNSRKTATDCAEAAFDNVRQMAWAMGALRGVSDPSTNHSVTAYTDPGTLKANEVQFETVGTIPLTASNRFITFSTDAAETNCSVGAHAMFKFYLLNGSEELATFTHPIEPCVEPTAVSITAPAIGSNEKKSFKVGTFAADKALLFSGSQLGIRMRNGQGATTGNDAAFGRIEVLDATPQLDKAFSPSVLNVGETSLLTFTITNTSELAAKEGWSFKDTLPAGLVVAAPAAASSTCASPTTVVASAGGGTISVKGSLAAEMNYCTVNVNVTSSTAGTYTDGPANISEEVGIDPPANATVQFGENADLQIEKTAAPDPATPGTDETYTLTVTNQGPNTAANVVVSDPLPAGLTFVSASPGCSQSAGELGAPRQTILQGPLASRPLGRSTWAADSQVRAADPQVTCTLPSLGVKDSATFSIVAHIPDTATEGLLNTATVTSSTPDPDLSNNEDTVSTPLAEKEAADLAVEKVASLSSVTAGGQVSYTVTVTNKGPHAGTGVTVTDSVPPALSVISAQPSQGSCDTTAGVRCELGTIANGGSAQILITANVAPDAHDALTNTALVAGNEPDPDTSNNTSTATTPVTPLTPQPLPNPPAPLTPLPAPAQPVSDLEIVKHVDRGTSHPGQLLSYTLRVTNHGLDDAPDFQVTDSSSLDLKIISVHATQGSCTTVARPIRCSLGTIKRDTGASITVLTIAERTGTERNTATVTSSNRDPNPSNNQSSVETEVLHRHRHPSPPPPPVTG
jgi:uncharacterized repeat protein (TIGR01451 family)